MSRKTKLALALILGSIAQVSLAESCRTVHWRPGDIINVKSAMNLGTRIQFPSDLVVNPPSSNASLWETEGAATTLLIKPNSLNPEGLAVILRPITRDGNNYDIRATRTDSAQNDVCVIITLDGAFFTSVQRQALEAASAQRNQGNSGFDPQQAAENLELKKKLQTSSDEQKKAVMEALSRYRYHVYTRYQWDQGKGFAANNLISDVYDDGRWTYIRLNTPNRGLLSVESVIGEKNAIVPATFDDRYGMYQINGIYPSFTLRVDDARINIKRADGATQGD